MGFGHFFIVWLRCGLAATWSQLLAIRLLLVSIGVGVGIGIGIDSDCVLWLVLTHGVACRYPGFVSIATMHSSKALRIAFPSGEAPHRPVSRVPAPIFCPSIPIPIPISIPIPIPTPDPILIPTAIGTRLSCIE
jgi:hypothetical protein